MFFYQIKDLKEQIRFLESEAEMQTNEIHTLEESVCSLDDISKQDQKLLIEMMKAEEKFNSFYTELTISEALLRVNGLKQALSNCVVPKISTVADAINLLVCIQNNMARGEDKEVFTNDTVQQLNEHMRELKDNLNTTNATDLTMNESMSVQFVIFKVYFREGYT